ncbi:membrane-associated Zn-dependent protease 1 [Providencia sp. PROV117]|uniref:membrane-associated Zn-dependent protease 1 n=1 Tax=Providencia sp. PROV117 TaxID=2949828 RepID=UPI00234A2AAA|nr:membrane-associated Zn-dependent protease 1 [Providencia sp. PROV117]
MMFGVFFRIVALTAGLFSFTALANGQAHLTFHMGAGANQQFFVGGTVENRGDTPIARAYVAILPVTERCELLPMAWKEFGPIPAHGNVEFRVPVASALTQYRLASFGAFDDMGFAVTAVDDTAAILKAREPEARQTCQAKRQ